MERKVIRTYTATRQDIEMLEAVARYHGLSKSGMITSLIRKELWRIFPVGTRAVKPERGAKVEEVSDARKTANRRQPNLGVGLRPERSPR